MGCKPGNGCYSTEPSTYPVSKEVTTTNSAGSEITSLFTYTTVITPSATVLKTTADAVAGYKQSTIAKMVAIETSTSSGGLSQAQLGGVIGGVVAIIIAIIVAAIIIMRRLRKNAKILKERHGTSAANETVTSSKPGVAVTTTVTEIDVYGNEIDPLMLEPPKSTRPVHLRTRSDSSGDGRYPSPVRSTGLGSGPSTPPVWPGQYNPVPDLDNGARHHSVDSAPEGHYDPASQYQVSQSSLHRTSYDSQTSGPHTNRHWSYASEVSGSADGQHGYSELDASQAAAARRRASSGAMRPAAAHIRRSSDPHQRGRSESNGPAVALLSTLNEINELHGYYGPSNKQVGQTAARPHSGYSPSTPEK
ncbi:hypothetical protein TruAng_008148 [Truncatella angustata]|nr:hypothetical protein TruAng_008148 [Truncatella angustata]